MSSATANDCFADRPSWAQAAYERQLATLARLTETGMEINNAIDREARALNADKAVSITPETQRAFEIFPRIARAVRLTLMLEDKLIRHMLGEDKPELPKGGKRGKDDKADGWEPIAGIQRVVIHEYPDGSPWGGDRPDRPTVREAAERRDRERLDRFAHKQPFDEAVEDIRHDLQAGADVIAQPPPSRMYPPMPGELPPLGRRSAGGRSSPGDWGF